MFKSIEKMMKMSDEVWEMHANPWSGWSRMAVLPLIVIAVWSRVWIGPWSIALGGVVLLWVWHNPRAFAAPKSTNNWMSKGVLGERVFLNRNEVPIPQKHIPIYIILSIVSGVALIPFIWGLVVLDLPVTLLSMVVSMMAKLWFLDRMVWLYEEMSSVHEPYAEWLRGS